MADRENRLSDFHSYSIDFILHHFHSDLQTGLSQNDYEINHKIFGKNIISEKKRNNWVLMFLKQWNNPVVFLLLIATIISFFLKENLNAFAILVVLFINTFIGFVMELQADRSMNALKKLSVTLVHVIRGGKLQPVNSETLVPGDIVQLEAGDMISADARIITANGLHVNESVLTGESIPVFKKMQLLPKETRVSDQLNMLFRGSHITQGNTKAIVVSIGKETIIGKLAELVSTAASPRTPLENRIKILSRKLIIFSLALLILVFISLYLRGFPFLKLLEISIAMGVAAIPEGLPVVVTITLTYGLLKMAKNNVVVRKLSAVESLGVTDFLCVDKTGTLTENKLKVECVMTTQSNWKVESPYPENILFGKMIQVAVLCNNAQLLGVPSLKILSHDPLEEALLQFALNANCDIDSMRKSFVRVAEIPFTAESRMMSTTHRNEKSFYVFYKGSLDAIFSLASKYYNDNGDELFIDETFRSIWKANELEMAESGLRVIAAAYSVSALLSNSTNVIFLGLFGLLDSPIHSVAESIRTCRDAGIDVAMLTGDHPSTAKNIAIRLGLMTENQFVVVGDELEKLKSDRKVKERILISRVFARVDPAQKLELVRVFQESGKVVAMTGDGVNDGPALIQADIGIAMGQRGTQVAQEAAAMILKDDSFPSIVLAVRQGRIIFHNIKMFLVYLLSCNLSEIMTVSIVTFFFPAATLLPLQILFMNLITDVLPALALGFSEGDETIFRMKSPSYGKELLNKYDWLKIFFFALSLAFCSVLSGYLNIYAFSGIATNNFPETNSIIFFTLVFSQLIHVFNMSGKRKNIFRTEVTRNRFVLWALSFCFLITLIFSTFTQLRLILGLTEIHLLGWIIICGCSILILPFGFLIQRIISSQ